MLVLDEPTSALDPQAAEEVLAALQRLVHDLGVTVVMAEHRLERVIQYADRVIEVPGGVGRCVHRDFRPSGWSPHRSHRQWWSWDGLPAGRRSPCLCGTPGGPRSRCASRLDAAAPLPHRSLPPVLSWPRCKDLVVGYGSVTGTAWRVAEHQGR